MKTITDAEVLHKIIEFQSCIIEGRSIKGLLHKNSDFFLLKSGADVITIYMNAHDNVKPEYILSKDKQFEHLINRYVFGKKRFKWDKFVENCNQYFSSGLSYERVTELYEIFKGFMSKKDADAFTEKMQIKYAVIMPIYDFQDKDIIGYICLVFKDEHALDIEKVRTIKETFGILLRPLYDKNYNTLYSKCVRVDENMNFLTKQEKAIVKKVLMGTSYPEVAKSLGISINTLKTHMKNIFNKYSVTSKIELFQKLHVTLK